MTALCRVQLTVPASDMEKRSLLSAVIALIFLAGWDRGLQDGAVPCHGEPQGIVAC